MKKTLVTICIILCFTVFVTACSKSDDKKESQHKPGILESGVSVGEDGVLCYLPNDVIEENQMQELAVFQEKLLSAYYVYDEKTDADMLHLRLLSMDTGELLYEAEQKTAGSYGVVVQVCKNRIAVSDAQAGKVTVYDETLKSTESFEVSGERIYVNPSITEAYCLTSAEGIRVINLKNQKEHVLLENARDLTYCSYTGTDLCVRYIDVSTADKKECYAGLQLEDGKLEVLEIDDSFSMQMGYDAGNWSGTLLAATDTYFIGTQQKPYKFQKTASYPSLQLTEGGTQFLLTETDLDGTQSVTAYQKDGTFLSACTLQETGGTMTGEMLWVEEADGYFFVVTDAEGHDKLYFWDLSKKMSGDDLQMVSYDTKEDLGGDILEEAYYQQAEKLSQKYHATIKIADQCETDYGDKTAERECTPDIVQAGLDVLEKTLTAYPENFFEQLHYGGYRKLEINLVGTITNKEEIEGYSPSAFVQHENGKILMVLNIDVDAAMLEQNFYHESSHIIDKVLEHDALYREDALYSEEKWQSLNPDKFIRLNPENGGYYGSYEMMPMSYYDESFTPYFASDYGKSFATEDRATIFEGAMIGVLQTSLYDKLQYYSECIRDCFDTSGWPKQTAWEKIMEK